MSENTSGSRQAISSRYAFMHFFTFFFSSFAKSYLSRQCIDTHAKKWVAQYDMGYSPPQMRIKGDGVLICTEIFVTWYLYQNAKRWKWEIKIGKEHRA